MPNITQPNEDGYPAGECILCRAYRERAERLAAAIQAFEHNADRRALLDELAAYYDELTDDELATLHPVPKRLHGEP